MERQFIKVSGFCQTNSIGTKIRELVETDDKAFVSFVSRRRLRFFSVGSTKNKPKLGTVVQTDGKDEMVSVEENE